MFRLPIIYRFQLVLMAVAIGLGLIYVALFKPLSVRVIDLNQSLVRVWDRLVEANLKSRAKVGLDLESVSQSEVLAQKAVAAVQKAVQEVRARVDLEPEIRERLRQPFQVLDFDQERYRYQNSLRTIAASHNVVLERAAIEGYPASDFNGGDRPGLWAQLAVMHYILSTAVSYGPATIKSAKLLPTQTYPPSPGSRLNLREFPVQLEMTGATEAIMNFLVSLPLQVEELRKLNYPVSTEYKPALFIDQLIIKAVPGKPNEVALEAVVSGFVCWERGS